MLEDSNRGGTHQLPGWTPEARVTKPSFDTYQLGETSMLVLLDAERSLLNARMRLVSAELERAHSFIRLAVATAGRPGGGGI